MLITNNYGNMWNTNKIVIHITKLRGGHDLFLFHTPWLLFKNFTDLQNVVEIKEKFPLRNNKRNVKSLNVKYSQRGGKIKSLLLKIEKVVPSPIFCHFNQQNLIIWKYFFPICNNISAQNPFNKPVLIHP